MSAFSLFFFFNDTATTEIYTLSLHDALPISRLRRPRRGPRALRRVPRLARDRAPRARHRPQRGGGRDRRHAPALPAAGDRKSTRLNSSHLGISYAVFCLKKTTPAYRGPHPTL